MTMAIATTIGTVGFYIIEGGEVSLLDCLYMTIITLSTVGYGEVIPLTGVGRVFASVLIITGMGSLIYFGSTAPAMDEALETLAEALIHLDAMRLRAYPFPPSVAAFIEAHDHVFVVEQNRDAQMRTLLINELELDPTALTPVLHYDGTPITARFIAHAITRQVHALAVAPRREKVR